MNPTIHIKGMYCASCELILEKELMKVESISKCEISHRKGTLNVECEGKVPYKDIKKIVQKCGYHIVKKDEEKYEKKKNNLDDYAQIFVIFFGVAAIAYLLQRLEITRFFPEFGSNAGIFVALLLGVVASLSTCLILVGGIVLSFGNMYQVKEDAKHPWVSRSLPHIYFHIGRIVGFAILGGILGLIGSKINYSLSFTGYLTIVVAIIMLYIGLQIIDIVPSITKLGFHLPKGLSKKINSLEEKNHPLTPMLIGVLTFLLPCGFTQSMQVTAIASGSFFTGALIMGAFAIGTFPALFSLGLGSSYAKKSKFKFVNRLIGVIVIIFAVYSLNSGLVLSGSNFTLDFWNKGGDGVESFVEDGVQVIKMDVDWGFEPNEFVVKKGVPVRWEIEGINISGCSNEIAIPRLDMSKKIEKGINIVEFTPEETGVIPFTCWMGMLGGKFIVVE
ncbi:sulfite exporter TauE/SafE family protein [Patescibacteria group bacterium]